MKKTTSEKIAEAIETRKAQDKEIRELRKQKKAEELAIKTQRHTERGAIAERLLDEKAELTNKKFQKKLVDILKVYTHQNRNAKTDKISTEETNIDEADES